VKERGFILQVRFRSINQSFIHIFMSRRPIPFRFPSVVLSRTLQNHPIRLATLRLRTTIPSIRPLSISARRPRFGPTCPCSRFSAIALPGMRSTIRAMALWAWPNASKELAAGDASTRSQCQAGGTFGLRYARV
jgi:hypothetical protein